MKKRIEKESDCPCCNILIFLFLIAFVTVLIFLGEKIGEHNKEVEIKKEMNGKIEGLESMRGCGEMYFMEIKNNSNEVDLQVWCSNGGYKLYPFFKGNWK